MTQPWNCQRIALVASREGNGYAAWRSGPRHRNSLPTLWGFPIPAADLSASVTSTNGTSLRRKINIIMKLRLTDYEPSTRSVFPWIIGSPAFSAVMRAQMSLRFLQCFARAIATTVYLQTLRLKLVPFVCRTKWR